MSAKYTYSNIRVAVIGCGNWGKHHVRVFHALGALYTICDTDPNHVQSMANTFNVPFGSLDEILESKQVDACIIATPASTHFDIAKKCLAAGKHVFIEKPISLESHHAEYLCHTARRENKILMVGHLLHYHPAFQKLKQCVQEGMMGNVFHLFAHRATFGKLSTETSVLWDVAPHDISMILSLMGELPYQVMATTSSHLSHHEHDHVFIDLWFSESRRAKVLCSWIHPIKEQMLTVVGDRYMGVFNDLLPWENKLQFYSQMNTLPAQAEPIFIQPSEPLKMECQHFLECIIDNAPPITDGWEALNVTRVLEAALISSKNQRHVSLKNESTESMSTIC